MRGWGSPDNPSLTIDTTAVLAIGLVLPKSCSRAVIMVQSAEHWHRYDLVRIRADHARCWNRDSLTKPLMGAARVEILEGELTKKAVQVTFPQKDDLIKTLLARAAEKSLHD